jgi:signal transduction histidine kinase
VTVEDDGVGFPVASVRDAAGQRFGLRTMQERTESVGGRLEILSGPWQGTRIVIRMPLAKPGSTL